MKKAKQARTVTTAVMDTGIRMSGILEHVIVDNAGNTAYLQFTGPVQICTEPGKINGHGGDYHIEGYGTPVGRIAEISDHTGISVEELSPEPGAELTILYTSGVRVQGELNKVKREKDQVILLTFIRCTVTLGATFYSNLNGVYMIWQWASRLSLSTADLQTGLRLPRLYGIMNRKTNRQNFLLGLPEINRCSLTFINKYGICGNQTRRIPICCITFTKK